MAGRLSWVVRRRRASWLTLRDETHDEILALVRELLARTPGVSFGQLVFSAAVPESDVLNIPDRAMLRALRARCYQNRLRPMVDGTISIEHLAALDEVHDEATATAMYWLRDQLEMIRGSRPARTVSRWSRTGNCNT